LDFSHVNGLKTVALPLIHPPRTCQDDLLDELKATISLSVLWICSLNYLPKENWQKRGRLYRLFARLMCSFLCYLLVMQQSAFAAAASNAKTSPIVDATPPADAQSAIDILNIKPEVDRLLALSSQNPNGPQSHELLALRALIVRKIFLGFLDVRRACNKVDIELDYTYGVLRKQETRQGNVSYIINQLTFAQFAALYTLQPYAREGKNFKESAILTCVGSGLGLILPITGILYNKYSRAHHTQPPAFLSNVLDGGPVDGSQMPPLVERYLDSNEPGKSCTRREDMYALWKSRYGIDAHNKASLCSLRGESGKSLHLLNMRIVLLWSLSTCIEDLDRDLLALLKMVRASSYGSTVSGETLKTYGLTKGAFEAATLLKIEPIAAELIQLRKQGIENDRTTELDLNVIESVLIGVLEMRVATDKIDGEINYAYDVVLSHLLGNRAKALQLNFDMNFMQSGVFSGIAGLLYLTGYDKAANVVFVVQKSFATMLAAIGLMELRGGTRKIGTPPNSLAEYFNPDGGAQYHFPPMISNYLSNPAPESSTGQSRRDWLIEVWKTKNVATIDVESKKNQRKLAALPPTKKDTITIVRNRIELMNSLKARLEEFDGELYDLVAATDPIAKYETETSTLASTPLNAEAVVTAKLLQVQSTAERLAASSSNGANRVGSIELTNQQLFVTRRILQTGLEARKAVDSLDLQIAIETTIRDRLVHLRDLAVNITNNINFFQIGILGIIHTGPLGLSASHLHHLYGNRINQVSGFMVAGLTAANLVERHGGVSLTKAQPNELGVAFNLQTAPEYTLPRTLSKFFNSVAPDSTDGLTRKDELIKYWTQTKLVTVNVEKTSVRRKLAADPTAHYWFSETIKLISNRIVMLYDMRATIDQIDIGLSDLLRSIG
jgi:hypothetical protein